MDNLKATPTQLSIKKRSAFLADMNIPLQQKQQRARAWVNGYTAAGTAIVIAAVFPGSTSAALIVMETHMCLQIGKIYKGEHYSMREAASAARVIGLVAVAAKLVALEALNAVPFAGWAVKGVVAGGVIKALGESIIAHYEKQTRAANGQILNAEVVYEQPCLPPVITNSTSFSFPVNSSVPIDERLRRIAHLLRQGFISTPEYESLRQQILREI